MVAGPFNPIAGIDKIVNTARKVVEVADIRNADAYFAEISTDEAKAWFAENMGGGEDEPSPEEKKAMAQMQADRERAIAELQLQRERAAAEVELLREKAAVEMQLRREEMQIEAQLTAEANRMNAAVAMRQADTNVESP